MSVRRSVRLYSTIVRRKRVDGSNKRPWVSTVLLLVFRLDHSIFSVYFERLVRVPGVLLASTDSGLYLVHATTDRRVH